MINRIIRAIKLDPTLYEEVEADKTATTQALIIVAAMALLTGLGSLSSGPIYILWGVIYGIVAWAIWAGIAYLVGAKLLPEPQTKADWGELARTTGFAQSVGVLQILGLIPVIGGLLSLIVAVWQAAAMVIAVRQSLDYTSTWRAIVVVLIGLIPYAILMYVLL